MSVSPPDSTEVLLPQFGMGMKDGTIVRWLKSEGDLIAAGDILCEIETAKATAEVESPVSGVLAQIVVQAQSTAQVRDVIAIIRAARAPGGKPQTGVNPEVSIRSDPASREPVSCVQRNQPNVAAHSATRQIEPRARRLAEQLRVDLETIVGSGAGGRITEIDVRNSQTRTAGASGTSPGDAFEDIPLTRIRQLIAERVTTSKQTVPHFYVSRDCAVDRLLTLRRGINAASAGTKLTINDFVVKAAALALKNVPEANVSWMPTVLRQYRRISIGVAVATSAALATVSVQDADQKSLQDISAEIRAKMNRAREGKLRPEDCDLAQLTVSNLGMYGASSFLAIVNPPQSCIFAIGAAERRPIVRGESVEIGTLMTCTLSVDHRAIDGAIAARLLTEFKRLMEEPEALIS